MHKKRQANNAARAANSNPPTRPLYTRLTRKHVRVPAGVLCLCRADRTRPIGPISLNQATTAQHTTPCDYSYIAPQAIGAPSACNPVRTGDACEHSIMILQSSSFVAEGRIIRSMFRMLCVCGAFVASYAARTSILNCQIRACLVLRASLLRACSVHCSCVARR